MKKTINIALVGNPNCGKSSLFNELTGLRQKVGNFPGVTVDKKTGTAEISPRLHATFIDLPGTYSLYPKRNDEWVSYKILLNQDKENVPDMILLVADASNLKRSLLFCSQIIDLKIPVVVALTMMDIAKEKGIKINIPEIERELGAPIVAVNPRKQKGIAELKRVIDHAVFLEQTPAPNKDFIYCSMLAPKAIEEIRTLFPQISNYRAIHFLIHFESLDMDDLTKNSIKNTIQANKFNATKTQAEEIIQRYARINQIMLQSVVENDPLKKSLITEKIDDVLLHPKWGYIILMAVLFILFQSVFWLAKYPMNFIEWAFAGLGNWCSNILPNHWGSDLFINGFLAGLSGILVFVPQIMILFGLITLLEDSGYMARISFLTDKIMRKFGLNGKSVMPMISGFACAVPAIMSARNIENKKERLLTILITPLMSCSARLPVYTILIALIIPEKNYAGFISLQGLVMMGLYIFGTTMALLLASILNFFVKTTEKSFFILELPIYRSPRWKNVFYTMYEKAKIFLLDAGKIIIIISVLLWGLSSIGPQKKMHALQKKYEAAVLQNPTKTKELLKEKNAAFLENSYAGIIGKTIEPVIQPLGYDWKIGIALFTSFAAREVFVGTMATLYSVGEDGDNTNSTLTSKMKDAKNTNGTLVYSFATGISLLLFYVLAMQCMSTIAVVRRETKSWKWPIIQLLTMSGMAYLFSFVAYQLLK